MRIRIAALAGLFATATVVGQSPSSFDVRAFGAKGDGKTLDTDAINRAISAANAAGGGTVRFPAGSYLSTSIHPRSHVGLFIDHGATIVAADATAGPCDEPEPNEWDAFQDFGHSHWRNSLIWGDGVEDVSITGSGVIHGKGLEVAAVDLDRVIVPRIPGSPVFVLRRLTDFLLRNSPGLPDKRLAAADRESF